MKQRGRKSTSALSIVPIDSDASRPPPPKGLTQPQAELWRRIVSDTPAGWFKEGDALLSMFCRHASAADYLSKLINAEPRNELDLRRLNRLLAMRARETQMVTHLATKMRLTPQAKMHPRSAGRAFDNNAIGPRPWEDD